MGDDLEFYLDKCKNGWLGREIYSDGDIKPFIPTLYKYAERCDHITEFGTRWVCATWVFAATRPKKIVTYDIEYAKEISHASYIFEQAGIEFKFHKENTLLVEIEETDMLFIDTAHYYTQLKQELSKHACDVKNFILIHDTELEGMSKAVEEFLNETSNWKILEKLTIFGGLIVLERSS